MKLLYALVLTLVPAFAQAATITLEAADLVASETRVTNEDGERRFGYRIDLGALNISAVHAVTVTDSNPFSQTGGRRAGFDLDAIGIGQTSTTSFGATEYEFNAGGTRVRRNRGPVQLFGATASNLDVDEQIATLDMFDGDTRPLVGFLSLGNGGSLTAIYGRALYVDEGDYLFVRGIRGRERLGQITLDVDIQPIPLPASGLLLAAGLGALLLGRRTRS